MNKKMNMICQLPLLLIFISHICVGVIDVDAFIQPSTSTASQLHTNYNYNSLQLQIKSRDSRFTTTCIASRENGEDDAEKDTDDSTDVSNKKKENEEPSSTAKVTLGLFNIFSYCIQFLGAFFFGGLILNLLGFGYTFDLDKGITIDKIDNIRNEVQFEREIIREETEELKEEAAAGGGMPGSKQLVIPDVPEGL